MPSPSSKASISSDNRRIVSWSEVGGRCQLVMTLPMAKARAIIKRRKAVDNIRKITRTMELIATNRFRKALNRATEAEAYTRKIVELVADLRANSQDISHPLLTPHDPIKRALLLVITSNRGLAGGYNGNVLRAAILRNQEIQTDGVEPVARGRGQARHQFLPVPENGHGSHLHPVRRPSPVS